MPLGKGAVSPLSRLYKQLEEKLRERDEFRNRNRRILAEGAALDEDIEVTETRIKEMVRGLYAGKKSGIYKDYEGKVFRVEVAAKYNRNFDTDRMLSDGVFDGYPGLIKTVVDKKALDQLIEAGEIDKGLVDKYTSYEQATPAVTFKLSKQDEEE